MLEPPQDISDAPQVSDVDDKTKRYRQAAEYNALLIQQRQERGPFYVIKHNWLFTYYHYCSFIFNEQ